MLGGSKETIDGREVTESGLVARLLASLNVTNAAVHPLPSCSNTHDEAVHTAKLARDQGWRRVLLVTSGYHMRRAEAAFRTQGLEVVPAACDFVRPGTRNRQLPRPYPIRGGFQMTETWCHEKAGWIVYRLRGWIDTEAAGRAP